MSFETYYQKYIVCPHCGHKEGDSSSYDLGEDPIRIICNNCSKELWASREATYNYFTHKVVWKLYGDTKISRCKDCDYLKPADASKKEWDPCCLKSEEKIHIDTKNDIPDFCELESVEADDEN